MIVLCGLSINYVAFLNVKKFEFPQPPHKPTYSLRSHGLQQWDKYYSSMEKVCISPVQQFQLILTFIGYIGYGHPIYYNTCDYSISKKILAFALNCMFSFVIKIVFFFKLISEQLCTLLLLLFNINCASEFFIVIKKKFPYFMQ